MKNEVHRLQKEDSKNDEAKIQKLEDMLNIAENCIKFNNIIEKVVSELF